MRVSDCPACGARAGGGYKAVAPGRVSCSACGAVLVYRMALGPLVLLAACVGVAVALVTAFVLDIVLRLPLAGAARTLLVGALTGMFVPFLARRFRRLHRVQGEGR